MSSPKQAELQEKKALQSVEPGDHVLGGQTITKPEDNRIFLADKQLATTAQSLDFNKIDIYQAHPGSDHAFGPDRRPSTLEDKAAKEVKASVELRFDNFRMNCPFWCLESCLIEFLNHSSTSKKTKIHGFIF